MLVVACLLIITDLFVIVNKKLSYVPAVLCLQVIVVTRAGMIMGMEVLMIAFVLMIKALAIPFLLHRIIRHPGMPAVDRSAVKNEWNILFVAGAFIIAVVFTRQVGSGPFIAAALFTAFTGILLISSRTTLLSQLTGFVLVQNGIFAFTLSFLMKSTFTMEIVTALDVLVAVFVMAYAVKIIRENSGSVDIKTFSNLRG